ncbi:MAG: hypothetical protein JO101_03735 [Candidatus Eremiobacteraeota bacterium]|nr:hypothetical protein [Candidatus Eremiobacteraeota bacterium]MBV8354405.1 hypothetical protein [Candidatus Eremiobacteraeota bacterium]
MSRITELAARCLGIGALLFLTGCGGGAATLDRLLDLPPPSSGGSSSGISVGSAPLGVCTAAVAFRAGQSRTKQQLDASCTHSNSTNFNAGSVPAGDYLWLSSVIKVSNLDANQNDTLYVFNSQVSITNPSGPPTVTNGPNVTITFDRNATAASLSFANNTWNETVPVNTSGNDFMAGIVVPGPIAGAQSATWSATFQTQSSNTLQVQWQFGAALYGNIGTDYSQFQVKELDDNNYAPYQGNSDHAGTLENEKSMFIGGAGTGGGGSNFTGSYSGTVNFQPCLCP